MAARGIIIFTLLAGFLTAPAASARFFETSKSAGWIKGMREIRPGYALYVEHRPAEQGKPTLFMINGLTWSTRDWQDFVAALDRIETGLGIVLYDPRGMGETLLRQPTAREPIRIEDQARDLKDLYDTLNIVGPKSMVSLSWGGALALLYAAHHPDDFEFIFPHAPLLEKLDDQDALIEGWIGSHRLLRPWDPRSDQELYAHYLRILIYATYPYAEPVLLENPFKLEATFRLVQGVLDFRAANLIDRLPSGRIHLVGARDDKFVKAEKLDAFWQLLRKKGASYLMLQDTEHKIPTERPEIAAGWVHGVIRRAHPALFEGRVFIGDPVAGEARSEDVVIKFRKAGICESLLRRVRRPF